MSLLLNASIADAAEPLFRDDFAEGLARWEVLDPATWKAADGAVQITARQSDYEPPHRSPYHVALVKDLKVEACRIEFRVRSPEDTGSHRDCCVFFGWQDPAHFYYVHLGARPDPRSGQIMLVNGADRAPLTDNQRPIPWTDGWHNVRVEHDPESGRIVIYFDGMSIMTVTDKTLGGGRVGIGSFDDRNVFDDVRVARLEID